MARGFSMPLLHSLRGGGLGNEVFPWAKAFIGAQELGLRCLHPPWALNPRGYRSDFGTSPFDSAAHWALRHGLPTIRMTPEMMRATGETDYARALHALALELPGRSSRPIVVTHESMHGGYSAIRRARDFLWRELMRPAHVVRDLYSLGTLLDPGKLTVGVHLRFGDFIHAEDGPRPGEYNKTLPDRWYAAVIGSILDAFPGNAQVLLVTDDPDAGIVRELLGHEHVTLPPQRARPVLSDTLALAAADILVSSISSFSMLAAFLSGNPYLWFGPHLNDHGGWRSIWGHEEQEQEPSALTARNLADAATSPDPVFGRGFAADGSGRVPAILADMLERRLWLRQQKRDLIFCGVIRPD